MTPSADFYFFLIGQNCPVATLSLEGGNQGGDFHYGVLPTVFCFFFTTKYVKFYSWICVHIDS